MVNWSRGTPIPQDLAGTQKLIPRCCCCLGKSHVLFALEAE
jgi:hypothetical protein